MKMNDEAKSWLWDRAYEKKYDNSRLQALYTDGYLAAIRGFSIASPSTHKQEEKQAFELGTFDAYADMKRLKRKGIL